MSIRSAHVDETLASRTGVRAGVLYGVLRNEWALAGVVFLFTRLFALAGAYIGSSRLIQEQPQYSKGWLAETSLMWDAAHYATLSQAGYSYSAAASGGSNVSFAPLYPALVNVLGHLLRFITLGWNWGNEAFGSTIAAGLIISNVSFFVALALLVKWLRPRIGLGWASVVALGLACLPTAFFFSALYTESLFLVLVLGTFLLARSGLRHKWLLVGLLAMLATLTRFTGPLLLPVLVVDYMAQRGWNRRRVRPDMLWLGLIPLAVALYIGFLWWKFGDPNALNTSMLKGWNHQTSFFLQTYWNSATQLWNSLAGTVPAAQDPVLFYGQGSRLYLILDLALPLVLLVGAWIGRKHLLASEWVWLMLGIVYPLSTNITFSLARYVLPLWPGLIWLGVLKGRQRWLGYVAIGVSLLLMTYCTYRYAGARWIG